MEEIGFPDPLETVCITGWKNDKINFQQSDIVRNCLMMSSEFVDENGRALIGFPGIQSTRQRFNSPTPIRRLIKLSRDITKNTGEHW